jgi:hypothetical protein
VNAVAGVDPKTLRRRQEIWGVTFDEGEPGLHFLWLRLNDEHPLPLDCVISKRLVVLNLRAGGMNENAVSYP